MPQTDLFNQPIHTRIDHSSEDTTGMIRVRSTMVELCQINKFDLIVLDVNNPDRCTYLDGYSLAMDSTGMSPNTLHSEMEGNYYMLLYKAKWIETSKYLTKIEQQLVKLFHVSWFNMLRDYLTSDDFLGILKEVKAERAKGIQVHPTGDLMFRAFKESNLNQVRAIILLQDPYPTHVANGIPVAVTPPEPKTASILRMEDVVGPISDTMFGTVRKQGLLMLNSAWSVEHKLSNSHSLIWEPFTRKVMDVLGSLKKPKVFILMGKNAKTFASSIEKHHKVVFCEHPVKAAYEERTWNDDGAMDVLNKYYLEEFNGTVLKW